VAVLAVQVRVLFWAPGSFCNAEAFFVLFLNADDTVPITIGIADLHRF